MGIPIKSTTQIESEMVQATIAGTPKLTWFGDNGATKSIIKALAAQIRDLYYYVTKVARSRFLDTAMGDDLLARTSEDGITSRITATPASAPTIWKGTNGTRVPQGTRLQSQSTGIIFLVTNSITIGDKNSDLFGGSESFGLADAVLAEAQTDGAVGNVPAGDLMLMDTIEGITSATNPVPASGGLDAETDDQLRERDRNRINLLNQGTQAFYEALALETDASVLRALVIPDLTNDGVEVILIRRSGAAYEDGRLTSIAASIYLKQRAFNGVRCSNVSFTGITIAFTTALEPDATLTDVYTRVADALANFLDFQKWGWGVKVQIADIVDVINSVSGVGDMVLATFAMNGVLADALVDPTSLPRFARLIITDTVSSTTKDITLDEGYV